MHRLFTVSRSSIIALLTVAFVFTVSAQLNLRTWTGVKSNNYADSSNWNPLGYPMPTDSIVIPPTNGDPQMTNAQHILSLKIILIHSTLRP